MPYFSLTYILQGYDLPTRALAKILTLEALGETVLHCTCCVLTRQETRGIGDQRLLYQ